MDYKEQERSNLIFSEFRRSLRAAKLFYVYMIHSLSLPTRWDFFVICLFVSLPSERLFADIHRLLGGRLEIAPTVRED